MPLRFGAVLLLTLLSGCGILDFLTLSARSSNAPPPSDGFFDERGEADEAPSAPVQEGGGEVTLE
jgi:hypothetical protein